MNYFLPPLSFRGNTCSLHVNRKGEKYQKKAELVVLLKKISLDAFLCRLVFFFILRWRSWLELISWKISSLGSAKVLVHKGIVHFCLKLAETPGNVPV